MPHHGFCDACCEDFAAMWVRTSLRADMAM